MAAPLEGPPLTVPMFDPEPNDYSQLPWARKLTARWQRWYSSLVSSITLLGTRTQTGSGDPNGVVTANRGTIYLRTDGAAGTTLYVKETGDNTNTGWAAK